MPYNLETSPYRSCFSITKLILVLYTVTSHFSPMTWIYTKIPIILMNWTWVRWSDILWSRRSSSELSCHSSFFTFSSGLAAIFHVYAILSAFLRRHGRCGWTAVKQFGGFLLFWAQCPGTCDLGLADTKLVPGVLKCSCCVDWCRVGCSRVGLKEVRMRNYELRGCPLDGAISICMLQFF